MSELYNKSFTVNAMSIIMRKSARKNAKTSEAISVNHLIDHTENRQISDERITEQFVSVLEKIVYQSIEFNGYLRFSVYADIGKNVSYVNANNENYHGIEVMRYYNQEVTFSSIEQAINFLFFQFSLIYPYNEISSKELFNNASVRYLIHTYYHN